MNTTERQSRTAHRQTVVGCKETIVALRNFVLRGSDLDDFAQSLIMREPLSDNQFTPHGTDHHPVFVNRQPMRTTLSSQDDAIVERLDPVVQKQTLTDMVALEIVAWVDSHIPRGAFAHADDIAAWKAHKGLEGASGETRMWFWMASDWWKPRR
ncbi:MAG: hypothetical protein EOP84_30530 [Verrucomicrobiaceae bacterium]|nr:MAG: hypothetical protein EOP84_30530 [Verrucomicrobiaceae bacterium]